MCYCACFCSNIIEAFQKCEHVIWYMWKARFHSFGVSRHLRLSTTFSRLQNFTELMESKWCDPPTQPPTPKKKKKKETDSTPHRTTSSHRVVEFQSSTVRKNEIVLKVLVNEGQSEVPSSRGWRSFLFLCPNILSQCREAATRGKFSSQNDWKISSLTSSHFVCRCQNNKSDWKLCFFCAVKSAFLVLPGEGAT